MSLIMVFSYMYIMYFDFLMTQWVSLVLFSRAWVGVCLEEPRYFAIESVTVSPFPINHCLCINHWRKLGTHQPLSLSLCVLMGQILCKQSQLLQSFLCNVATKMFCVNLKSDISLFYGILFLFLSLKLFFVVSVISEFT